MPQTLYLKYRPQHFDNVIGQEIARITLKNAAKEGKLSHAYLFTGPRGTGKTSMARIVAKAINCLALKSDGNPCNECTICKSVMEGRLVDIIEIDAASHTGVDDVRDIIDKARFMPNEAKKKVYIIDEVHQLSKPAFNALLKTLEEPPDHVHFILATTEGYKVPETIVSRCQKFDFKRIEIKDIVYQLKIVAIEEGFEYEIKALNLIAKVAEGGMRNALGILEKVVTNKKVMYDAVVDSLDITGIHIIEGLYEDIENKRVKQAVTKVNDLYESGASLSQFSKDFVEFIREKFLEAVQEDDNVRSLILLRQIDILEQANSDLKSSIIPQLPLEMAMVRMCFGDETILIPKDEKKKEEKQVVGKKEKKLSGGETKKEEQQTKGKETVIEKNDQDVSVPVSLQSLQETWNSFCQAIPSAKYKPAFKNTIPIRLEANIVTVGVHSKSYLEIIRNSAASREMEEILEKFYGKKLIVKAELEKIESLTSDPGQKTTDKGKIMSAEDAAEILGGNIMEE